MVVDLSEEEQVEAIKKWCRENGRSAIIGVALGIAMVISWNVWQTNRQSKSEQASDIYQQLLNAMEGKNKESAFKLSERLIDLYDGSVYALYGKFFLSKLNVENNDLPAAKKVLEEILQSGVDNSFKHIARLRLLRVLAASGEAEVGLKIIELTDIAGSGKFEAQYEESRGDLFVALDKEGQARAAYQRSQQIGDNSPYLQLKIDDLAAPEISELSEK